MNKSSKFLKNDQLRLDQLKSICDELHVIHGCEWKALKAAECIPSNSISRFYRRKNISEAEIYDAIDEGDFYGMIQVDIESPPDVIEYFKKVYLALRYSCYFVSRPIFLLFFFIKKLPKR